MNGPQHYREAERLIDPDGIAALARSQSTHERSIDAIRVATEQAQVHATLALAAATALAAVEGPSLPELTVAREWQAAIR